MSSDPGFRQQEKGQAMPPFPTHTKAATKRPPFGPHIHGITTGWTHRRSPLARPAGPAVISHPARWTLHR